jgi:hypothetical protein
MAEEMYAPPSKRYTHVMSCYVMLSYVMLCYVILLCSDSFSTYNVLSSPSSPLPQLHLKISYLVLFSSSLLHAQSLHDH